jgi:hypothetical protein
VKDKSPTELVVLMASVGVGMILGWVFGREWLKVQAKQPTPKANPSRALARLHGCLDVERN